MFIFDFVLISPAHVDVHLDIRISTHIINFNIILCNGFMKCNGTFIDSRQIWIALDIGVAFKHILCVGSTSHHVFCNVSHLKCIVPV